MKLLDIYYKPTHPIPFQEFSIKIFQNGIARDDYIQMSILIKPNLQEYYFLFIYYYFICNVLYIFWSEGMSQDSLLMDN